METVKFNSSAPTVEKLQARIESLYEMLAIKAKLISLLEEKIETLETGERPSRQRYLHVV